MIYFYAAINYKKKNQQIKKIQKCFELYEKMNCFSESNISVFKNTYTIKIFSFITRKVVLFCS